MGLRDVIFGTSDITTKPVEVPEWNTTVFVRTLTAADVAKIKGIRDELEATVALVLAATVDEAGQRVFTDQDADKLKLRNWSVIDRIAVAALTANGMTGEAVDAAKKG